VEALSDPRITAHDPVQHGYSQAVVESSVNRGGSCSSAAFSTCIGFGSAMHALLFKSAPAGGTATTRSVPRHSVSDHTRRIKRIRFQCNEATIGKEGHRERTVRRKRTQVRGPGARLRRAPRHDRMRQPRDGEHPVRRRAANHRTSRPLTTHVRSARAAARPCHDASRSGCPRNRCEPPPDPPLSCPRTLSLPPAGSR
jgi:hypothetical protein